MDSDLAKISWTRTVMTYEIVDSGDKIRLGLAEFLGFSTDSCNVDEGVLVYPIGICRYPNGKVKSIHIENLQFLKEGETCDDLTI